MLTAEAFEAPYRINVTAGALLARGLRQSGVHAEGASLVLVSSVVGLAGQPGVSAYSATKGSVLALTRSLALELAADRIRVNCVVPGQVRSEMFEQQKKYLLPEQVAAIEAAHPLGLGEPEDVARAIAFLLSPASRWITGTGLVVDGGYLAR
jgi:NAD(P)-dependent dehydrogenase (short-subunit alcohol dehydrogenase family)